MVPSSNSWRMKSGIELNLLSSFLLLLKLLRGSSSWYFFSNFPDKMLNIFSVLLSCVIFYFVWRLTLLKLLPYFYFLNFSFQWCFSYGRYCLLALLGIWHPLEVWFSNELQVEKLKILIIMSMFDVNWVFTAVWTGMDIL